MWYRNNFNTCTSISSVTMLCSGFFIVLCLVTLSHSFSDVGKWDLQLSGKACEFRLSKSLFKDSQLLMSALIHCDVEEEASNTKSKRDVVKPKSPNITIFYTWTPTLCSPDYFHYFEKRVVDCQFAKPDPNRKSLNNDTIVLQTFECSGKLSINGATVAKDANIPSSKALLKVEKEGVYEFYMAVSSPVKYNATVRVEMVAPSGYLSAAVWPLLPFFGIMCGIYTVLCTCWLLVCGLNWRDLLRIQYWIGGVALLGMIESATYYGVYSSINRTGYFNAEAFMFAEWVSVAKRALARMLVIIVSLGFGIVKPRLGPALQRVVGTGLLWGLLAAIEAWLRLHHKADDTNRDLLLSEAPLSLLDSAICWWVFVSLAHTMRTLQLRRNTIKLSLYRHFTNTLIFAVISSVIFMLYSIKSYRVLPCITEWKEVWMDEAYWHMLFASVLTAIMVLWRPTNNNQRYAFTPLLDNADDDEDEEEQFVNDAYGVKMRGPGINNSDSKDHDTRESNAPDPSSNSLDSDLRWVEENIPTSTLPLLDSDEEIINTKFEVSKMQ